MTDWTGFEHGLASALRSVTERVFLIIASGADPRRYVQFAGGQQRLDAEAPGTEVVAIANETTLSAAGWTAASFDVPNWTSSLELPALTAEFQLLAGRCVTALRDAYGIPSPDYLWYRAWREPEQMPAGVTWSPERIARLDRGESALKLPRLGLATN